LVLAFGHDAAPHGQGLEDGTHDHLVFRQPTTAGVGIDFHIHLRVPSVTATGPIQVELSAPESFGIRTANRCPASATPATAGSACGTVTNRVFEVDWTVTPKATSSSDLWVILPAELRPDAIYGSDWVAFPYIEGHGLMRQPESEPDRGSGEAVNLDGRMQRIAPQPEAVRLDASSPTLSPSRGSHIWATSRVEGRQDYDVDLSSGRLGTHTTVVRTLGVSDATYTRLTLFGAVACQRSRFGLVGPVCGMGEEETEWPNHSPPIASSTLGPSVRAVGRTSEAAS
jgi:hypothetical protein